MIIAVVVVVVVIVAFLGLYFAGAIPGLKPSSSASSTGVTFSAARTAAQSASGSYSSTYPNLVAVLGIGLNQPLSGQASQLGPPGGSGCTVTLLSGAQNTITVPAGASGGPSGSLPFWEFIYSGATGMLLVIVINGQGSALATIATGGSCTPTFSSYSAIPSGVIDSSAAASAAGATTAGAAFLKNNSNANAVFFLFGGASLGGFGTGASWLITYSECSFAVGGGTGNQPQFEAILNASSGAVTTSSASTSACNGILPTPGGGGGGGGGLASNIAMGTPSESHSAGSPYWYNFTVQSAGGGLTWNNLDLELVNSTGMPLNPQSTWTATVLSIPGTSVATYSFQTFGWTSGGSTTITAAQVLSVSTPTSLSGDDLNLLGTGSFSGLVQVAIP